MSVKEQFLQLTELGKTLLAAIENESWDSASQHALHWDKCIRGLFNRLSSDQFDMYKINIENLEMQNQIIQECLTHLRAKTLTQLHELNDSRIANKYYNESI